MVTAAAPPSVLVTATVVTVVVVRAAPTATARAAVYLETPEVEEEEEATAAVLEVQEPRVLRVQAAQVVTIMRESAVARRVPPVRRAGEEEVTVVAQVPAEARAVFARPPGPAKNPPGGNDEGAFGSGGFHV